MATRETIRTKISDQYGNTHTIEHTVVDNEGVLIFYGNGYELGDFGQFASSLKKDKLQEFSSENIIIEPMQNKNKFFDYLLKFDQFKIKELHIFCHAAGGGIYIGYHNEESSLSRNKLFNESLIRGSKVTYEEVRDAEIGAVLTDDFFTDEAAKNESAYRAKFSKNKPLIKLWGCNAGIANWRYHDEQDGTGQSLYYWRALNEKNVPKPAIAQAFADYFNVPTYGGLSGSHIEYKVPNGTWAVYKKQPANASIRLHPDHGEYHLFNPK